MLNFIYFFNQAINHTDLKNIVGTYYVPTAVFCNVSIFESLNEDNIRSGSGELTKNAVLFGGKHRNVLEPILKRHQVRLACLISIVFILTKIYPMFVRIFIRTHILGVLFIYIEI